MKNATLPPEAHAGLETPTERSGARFAAGNVNELETFALPTRRRWPTLVAGAALGATVALAAPAILSSGDDAAVIDPSDRSSLATAPVEVRDLIDEVEWTADLGYGSPVTITAATDLVITATVDAGTVLERGDAVFEADGDPVPLLYGQLPQWRRLAEGVEGPDVAQLEQNLVALGYDPDTTVTIDDVYTANTAAMVERWQTDLGVEATGTVELGAMVVAAGPVSATTPPARGADLRAGTTVAVLSVRTETATVVGTALGDVTDVVPTGTTVTHGTVLYEVDASPVVALTEVDTIASYLLDPDSSVSDLESALLFSGHDPEGAMEIDDVADEATSAAVQRWQEANGITPTGVVDATGYHLIEPGLRVVEQLVVSGETLSAPRPILDLGASTRSITIPVALADQDEFVSGQQVTVELPDESLVGGMVTDVGTVAQAGPTGGDLTIDVVVQLTEAVDDDLPASPVIVVVAGTTITDALVVPTRALVTLAEGGFAVEKVLDDDTTALVAVETGAFDDGVVEVVSSQLQPGDDLVVPQ